MTPLSIIPDAERGTWPPVTTENHRTMNGALTHIGLLRHGTGNGKASVSLAGRLEDGRVVYLETTWALLQAAARALAAGPVGSEEVIEP